MALPDAFEKPEDYFEQTVQFFRDNQYLFNFPNTRFLTGGSITKINIKGLEEIDVFQDDFSLSTFSETNSAIKDFLDMLKKLSVEYTTAVERVDIGAWPAPIGPKKKHEILHLSQQIEDTCKKSGCNTIVDFGSGLGYLDQFVYDKSKFNVLGVEGDRNNYNGAERRQRMYFANSTDKVKYARHTITENSDAQISDYLGTMFSSHTGICITGLHACGDLSIDAINIFLKLPVARSIVLMSCCYHKMMTVTIENQQRFKNFPLSSTLKQIYERQRGFEYMATPFLRLAAHPQCSNKNRLKVAVFCLLARAVIQLYADNHGWRLVRRRRRIVRINNIQNDYNPYIQQTADSLKLCNNNECKSGICTCDLHYDVQELHDLWTEFTGEAMLKKTAVFLLLHCSLQPICENFLLYDRLVYLKENGINCSSAKLVNETISPRCVALLAIK